MTESLYETLGVGKDATPEEIKNAYRQQAKSAHPDSGQGSPEKFGALTLAYNTLRNPEHRRMYDEHGHAPEDEGARIHQQAEHAIASSFFQILTTLSPEIVEQTDIIALMRDRFRKEIGKVKDGQKTLFGKEEQLKKYQHVVKKRLRRKKKKPEVFFTKIIADAFAGIVAERATLEKQFQIKERAIEILKDYVFDAQTM